jgi:hypothetical protein
MKGRQVDIVERKKSPNGSTFRVLACGHDQLEPKGGKAHLALTTICVECKRGVGVVELKLAPKAPAE